MSPWRTRPAGIVCCVTRNSSKVCPGVGRDRVRAAALPKRHYQECWALPLLSLLRGKENHKPPHTELPWSGTPLLSAARSRLDLPSLPLRPEFRREVGRLEWKVCVGLGEVRQAQEAERLQLLLQESQ